MDNLFMNSRDCKRFESYRLLLNLSDKIDLKRSNKYFALSNLSIYYTWEIIKISYSNNKLKTSASTDNRPIRICINKIENRVIFIIKTGYYLEL